jgi:glycosyltransferase involved in cell wall biosynthesis
VIIPAYYSHETVAACLEALRGQTFRDFEIILINSSPESQTGRIIQTRFPEVVFEQSPGRLLPHAARNRGVAMARGELLVFTDPDCAARPDWLVHLVQAHDAGHAVVGGSMGLTRGRWLERGVHLRKFFWLLRGMPEGPCRIVCTANAAYSRAVWNRIGPLQAELFTADALLSMRACAAGFGPWFEPLATVDHRHDGGIGAYWREFLGRGAEFAGARADVEQWTRWRAGVYLALMPVVTALVLTRAGRCAWRSGWGMTFLTTLPVHLVFLVAWSLGEARAYWTRLTAPSRAHEKRASVLNS